MPTEGPKYAKKTRSPLSCLPPRNHTQSAGTRRRDRSVSPVRSTHKHESDTFLSQSPRSERVAVCKPSYKSSGLLERQANSVAGTVLKYTPPADAASPQTDSRKYYMYHYASPDTNDAVKLLLTSADHYIIGRDAAVCDWVIPDRSVSKQHAVIQFRRVGGVLRPFVMDLESVNGTVLNDDPKDLPPARYVELVGGDVLRFGDYEGEYILVID